MGRARMYAKTREKYIRKMSKKTLLDKMYQEVPDKPTPFTGEQKCPSCGFKVRYQFVRCPECDSEQK